MIPEFLNFFLNSVSGQRAVRAFATPGVSQSNINAQKLGAFELPFCRLAEQEEIVRRVEALFALADQIEARLAKARAHVNKLTPSLLARAFCGELVPTEAELARREKRDYESASALLERIRSEHERAAHQDQNPAEPRRRTQRATRSTGAASVSRRERSTRAGNLNRRLGTTRP